MGYQKKSRCKESSIFPGFSSLQRELSLMQRIRSLSNAFVAFLEMRIFLKNHSLEFYSI